VHTKFNPLALDTSSHRDCKIANFQGQTTVLQKKNLPTIESASTVSQRRLSFQPEI
jgi:hypothetical protein